MNEIKRFDVPLHAIKDDGEDDMVVADVGDYVLYDDHIAELKKLKDMLADAERLIEAAALLQFPSKKAQNLRIEWRGLRKLFLAKLKEIL